MKQIAWIVFWWLALAAVGCTQKEHSDSSVKEVPPITSSNVTAEQKETAVVTKRIAVASQNDAVELVRQQIITDKRYEWSKQGECLGYIVEDITDKDYDIAVHEVHTGNCGGDPKTSPLVDRFRVDRLTGRLTWYNIEEGDYIEYSLRKKAK